MASSIDSQLQAISLTLKADSEPLKRPFTRPSILFGPKEAADIDIDSLLTIALSGLEVLISLDKRFGNYKNDLFSYKSRELDRELMGIEENNQINASISSYLGLLSGHFQLPSALKTLEYLIRRYKIHVNNTEELILCALPYHDTHVFVRIIQLLDTGNSKWKFLDGVKLSGAPPPRKVVVQQCIRDLGVLEVLCNYASPKKKLQLTRSVISFCTAVIVEVLGSLTVVDTDVVKRILPYVVSGLQTHPKGSLDHKSEEGLLLQLLAEFPSVLVPLSSNNQDIRAAAMSCIEGLFTLWPRVNSSRWKNGKSAVWSNFLGELLGLMVQQKRLILSDGDFLPEFFTTLLSPSHRSLLVPPIVGERFDQTSKDGILGFILGSAVHLSPPGADLAQ